MFQLRQDLPFASEPANDFVRIGSALQDLDRHFFLELAIGARGQENCAHSTAADFPNDSIRTDSGANPAGSDLSRNGVPQAVGAGLDFFTGHIEVGLYPLTQLRIVCAGFGHVGFASVAFLALECFAEDFLNFLPKLRRHIPRLCPNQPPNLLRTADAAAKALPLPIPASQWRVKFSAV